MTREQPKLRGFISELEQKREKMKTLEAEIDGLYQQEDESIRLRDSLIVKTGRIYALKISFLREIILIYD